MTSISLTLEVDDKGSVVVKKFSDKTVSKVKQMSDKSIGHVKRLSAKFTKTLGGAIGKVGRALTSLKTLAIGALAGWGVTKVLGEFATFETALVDMGKVTSESYDSIKKKIMELPPELGSATELTKGYYNVISAGVKGAANQLDTLTTASKQAKTAHADQAQVILGLTSVMDAFKVKSMEAADTLQIIEKTGKTTVSQLIPVIGELSSGSAALGISLDAMGAAFAAVTLQSGGTEKAATQYKALLTSLLAPTEDMTNLLARYGGAQEAIKQIGFGGVLQLIKGATKGNAAATKKLLGSVEAYLGFLGASANNMQTYNQNLEEQKNKTGAVDQAWKDYMKTLNAIWDTFKNTVGKQVILIGEKLAPAVKKAVKSVSALLEKYREFITLKFEGWINNALGGIASLIEGIAGAVESLYSWKSSMHSVIKYLANVGGAAVDTAAALLLISNPVLAAKAAVFGLRETFPALAEMRDRFDAIAASQAKSAREATNSQKKFAGYGKKIRGVADDVRDLITTEKAAGESSKTLSELHDAMVKKMEANTKSAATNMATVWKDKIVLIDGVYTNIKEKVEIPMTVAIEDQATQPLQAIQAQAEKTEQVISKDITISVIDQATPVLQRIQAEIAKIKSKTVTVTVNTKFTGEGSSTLPLSEKIKELDTSIQSFASKVSATTTESKIKFTGTGATGGVMPAGGAIQYIEDKWSSAAKTIEKNVPKLDIDVSPALRAIEEATKKYQQFVAGILHARAKLRRPSIMPEKGFDSMADLYAYQLAKARLTLEKETELITGYYEKHPISAYATGTDYVPRTGLYQLHRGEIVIPPQQSNQIRNQRSSSKSISNNTTVGDVHIHIPPNTAPQSTQDWRYITREVIIPELKRAAYN